MAGDQVFACGCIGLVLLLTCLGLTPAASPPPSLPRLPLPPAAHGYTEESSNVPCGDDTCQCNNNTALADCFNTPARNYIPTLPLYITSVYLQQFSFDRVTNETLYNLTLLRLETLHLFNVETSYIDPTALSQFPFLQHLIVDALFMSHSMLQAISHTSLTTVLIRYVLIDGALEFKTFENMTNLTSLECFRCFLSRVSTSAVLPRVENFFLTTESTVEFPDFCPNNTAVLPNVRNLTIEISEIVLDPRKINCLSSLTYFDLRGSTVSNLFPHSFLNLSSLLILKTSTIYAASRNAFSNSNVREIEVGELGYFAHYLAFSDCPKLERLQMTFVMAHIVDTVRILAPSLKYLRLTSPGIVQFPEAISGLSNLVELSIPHSGLSRINGSVLGNMTNLTKLILNNNYISSINADDIPSAVQKRLKTVDLSDNPLDCSCNSLWLKNWMHSNTTYFENYPEGYVCNNKPYQPQTLEDTLITDLSCVWVRIREPVVATSVIVFFFIVALPIVYRYRWRIQYYAFMLRYNRRQRNGNQEEEPNYRYDAFVSYDSHNHWWIRGHLMPALEDQAGLRLCIHERDFLAGKLIVDNIMDSITGSRKVIVVLSESFAASEWCQFELSLTHRLMLERGRDLMVLVMLEEIPRNRMTKLIYAVLKTITYISWPVEERAREDFFHQLAEAIR